jgi:hypothetical protein
MSNLENVDYVHRVRKQGNAVGLVVECYMLVVIPTDSGYTVTAPSMTPMPLLTYIL